MLELILGFSLMLLLVLAMSIGVIFARKPIKGTCGGIASLGMDSSCDICGGDMNKCEEENASGAKAGRVEASRAKAKVGPETDSLAYDASKN